MSSGALFVEPIVITTGGALWSTNVTGGDPAAWSNAVPYALNEQVTYLGSGVYQSIQAANSGHEPTMAGSEAWWVRVGAVNSMRMFDLKVGSQTENADTIEVAIKPTTVVQVLSLRHLGALQVTVVQTSTFDGEVYNKTKSLDEPVADWYEYFFSDILTQTEVVFTDLKPYADCTITVTIDNTGGTAKCGELLMGPAMDIGITEAGVQDGIDDYSIIAPDAFGVRDIVERDYADNMELTLYVPTQVSPTLRRFLAANRATPFLLVPNVARPDAQVFGLAESWRRILSYPGTDVFNISMKGVT